MQRLLGALWRFSALIGAFRRSLALLGVLCHFSALFGASQRSLELLGALRRFSKLFGASWRSLAVLGAHPPLKSYSRTTGGFEVIFGNL